MRLENLTECKHVIVPSFEGDFYFCLKCKKKYELKDMLRKKKRLPPGWEEIKNEE